MRLACREDFEEEGGLYWPPFQDYPHFAERAEYLSQHYRPGSVLIVGAAYGFTVKHCRDNGVEAWGMDASAWALEQAQVHCPEAVPYLIHGDVTKAQDVRRAAQQAGVQRFTVAVTEDLMPMLAEDEITTACAQLRRIAREVLHWVTPKPSHTPHPSLVSVKTGDEWQQRLAPDLTMLVGV